MIELPMESFLRGLFKIRDEGFDTPAIEAYLKWTLIQPDDLRRYVFFRSDRYTRNLVYKDDDFELLVICWNTGQQAPVHGHEGERCWSRVEQGKLNFTNYREVSDVPCVIEPIGDTRCAERGHVDGPADVHKVDNPGEFQSQAISLHLYSDPYDECDVYDLASGERLRVKLSYDSIGGQRVARGDG